MPKVEGGPIETYLLHLRVVCTQCNKPFEFRGLPMGLSLSGAAMDVTKLEARLAIRPTTLTDQELARLKS